MLSAEENERLTRVSGRTRRWGDALRRYWLPALLSEELPGARRRAGARAPAGRRPGRVSRHRRQRRACRRVLPAPARADVLRPQRRVRLALRLPRLEVRSQRRVRRHALRAAGLACSRRRSRSSATRPGKAAASSGPTGPARTAARAARLRAGARAGDAPLRLEDVRGLQLAAGARRRARYVALVVLAQQQASATRSFLRNRDDASPRIEVEKTDYGYTLRRHPQRWRERHVRARLSLHHAVAADARRA